MADLLLLPRHDIYLEVTTGDGARFVEMFRATWRRLPPSWRRSILAHWRVVRPFTMRSEFSSSPRWGKPSIVLGNGRGFLPSGVYGAVSYLGCRMRFRSTAFDRFPANVAQDVIAHELAHVLQCARGIRAVRRTRGGIQYADGDGKILGGALELEADADRRIEGIGFDPYSCDEWRAVAKDPQLAESVRRIARIARGRAG